jgi:hypothetical protein
MTKVISNKIAYDVTHSKGDNAGLPLNPLLASFIVEVFAKGTASAYTPKRFEMTQALVTNLPALQGVTGFVIESDEETIKVDATQFGKLLPAMVDAMKLNRSYRDAVAPFNTTYDSSVTVTAKVEHEAGKRGRKASDYTGVVLSLE